MIFQRSRSLSLVELLAVEVPLHQQVGLVGLGLRGRYHQGAGAGHHW
jgi:hypothetical protein